MLELMCCLIQIAYEKRSSINCLQVASLNNEFQQQPGLNHQLLHELRMLQCLSPLSHRGAAIILIQTLNPLCNSGALGEQC